MASSLSQSIADAIVAYVPERDSVEDGPAIGYTRAMLSRKFQVIALETYPADPGATINGQPVQAELTVTLRLRRSETDVRPQERFCHDTFKIVVVDTPESRTFWALDSKHTLAIE